MIQFDKLKLICSLDVVENINEQEFQAIVKDGCVTSYKYQQDTPFYLLIRKDFYTASALLNLRVRYY